MFHRSGRDDVILDISVVPGEKPIGSIHEESDLAKDRRLWPALLAAALVQKFQWCSRYLLSDRPVSVVGPKQRGFLRHPDLPEWIQRRTVLRFDTRTIHVNNKGMLGLVCEARLKSFIKAPCATLIESGIPVIGRYVVVPEPSRDRRLMDRMKLVGRVVSITDGMLVLSDNAEGYETLSADLAFLEPRREIVDACVLRLLGDRGRVVLSEADRQIANFHSGPGRREQIGDALKYIREKAAIELVPEVRITLGDMLTTGDMAFPATEMIARPILVFDPSGVRKDDWNERGLKKSGPYDQRTFSPKQLRIAVVCQARHEGRVDALHGQVSPTECRMHSPGKEQGSALR